MKNNISTIELNRLHNEEHFGFHSEFVKLVSEYDLNEIFQNMASIYKGHYGKLDLAMEIVQKSDFADDILAADRKRNRTFRSFRLTVEGCVYHFEPAKQTAGKRLTNILRQYGILSTMPRDKRTYAMTNLLQDMRTKGAADIQQLGLVSWINELEANNLAYKNLKECRYKERTQRPSQKVKDARNILDADYREIIKYLDAIHNMRVSMDDDLKALVLALEERISAYNHLLAQRKGMAAVGKTSNVPPLQSSTSSSLAVACVE
jgi:hypothetical protein